MQRSNLRLKRLAILMLLMISGCATAPAPSPYRVTMPVLEARPSDYQMAEGGWYRCFRREDAQAIVIELKAACLALGGSPEDCQTGKQGLTKGKE